MKIGLLLEGGGMRVLYIAGVLDIFYAVVTNIETGEAEYIKIEDLKDKDNLEYLRASGSMPFVSKPVNIHSKKYLDGGTADSIPIDKMMCMDYE